MSQVIENQIIVGVGIIVVNDNNQVLMLKRNVDHGFGSYSIPGGKVDLGEKFEDTAIRELLEETSLNAKNLKFIGVTNNLATFEKEGIHSISMIYVCDNFSGEVKSLEPEKHSQLAWYDLDNIPQPQFEGSGKGIEMFLRDVIDEGELVEG